MDVFDKEKRSWIMSQIKGKDTKPEIIVRSIVHRMGYRFRKNKTDLPGKPDIVFKRHNKIIFIHGCFWHGHKKCKKNINPTNNKIFWEKKIISNVERDKRNVILLKKQGWKILIIWECQIKDLDKLKTKISDFMTNF
jgi:DNA mismatch endonuclease, patch repair protein